MNFVSVCLLPASDLPDPSCWCTPTQSNFLSISQLTDEVSTVGKIGDDPLSALPEVSGPSPLDLIVFAVAQRVRECGQRVVI